MPTRRYSRATRHAAELLGAQIRAARVERRWTVAQLAERAGVAEKTVRNVEHGELGVALGTALECAIVVGVPVFYDDERRLAAEAARGRAPLIGRRVRPAPPEDVDLDF